ncbi:MAG: 50S ribosomal protein L15 [Candidatus Pacebacteria bacterium]|nr:50S ribosomal protein L15 [Candidatus Paceibacterota bacterium]
MQLHELKPTKARKTAKRIGRGGKRGKTSGRGHKGQMQHGGHGVRPEMRDIIKKLPKLRGHGVNRARTVNSGRVRPLVVNVSALETLEAGTVVTAKSLVTAELIPSVRRKAPAVKILGNGNLTKKLTVEGCQVSKSAQEKIEAAGGSVK